MYILRIWIETQNNCIQCLENISTVIYEVRKNTDKSHKKNTTRNDVRTIATVLEAKDVTLGQ